MSGHSKWANIKHKKGAADAKRSKVFQKHTMDILIAIQEGGNNPDDNSKLRLAIDKAKSDNMPNDNVSRLLKRSEKDTSNYKEIVYEGYGPGGVAVLVDSFTDNINRTVSSIKSDFSKHGGNLGTAGSVSYLFHSKGVLVLDKEIYDFDEVFEKVLMLNAPVEDVRDEGEVIVIETKAVDLIKVKALLEENEIVEFLQSEVIKEAESEIEIDEPTMEKLDKLIDALEENPDVKDIYTNVK